MSKFHQNIDWNETQKRFNITPESPKISNKHVVYRCPNCGSVSIPLYKNVSRRSHPECRKCISTKNRDKISKAVKKAIDNPQTRKRMSDTSKKLWDSKKEAMLEGLARKWSDPKFKELKKHECMVHNQHMWSTMRQDLLQKIRNAFDHERIEQISRRSTELWRDEKYKNSTLNAIRSDKNRARIAELSRQRWTNMDFRNKMADMRAQQSGKLSSLQTILYSILDDLEIKCYKEQKDIECKIGPYNFDCVIPLNGKKLLIECQGDYWHSLSKNISNDKAKATYVERHHPDCEIKYLWEHEFKCKDKIVELIKYWTGITKIELIGFFFGGVKIKECPPKDYRLLLSKYHYLPNAGRGGIAYGAYLGEELIAVCVFSPPIRQNLPYDFKTTRELSRLCIHPRYQKKNFASWFVSKCIKQLDKKYQTIVSYCDTTFNHDGAVYRACGFELDGEITPDYWYVSEDGWVMHKKTLYNHAVKMGLKEKEYAEINGYKKIYGKKKLRFLLRKT